MRRALQLAALALIPGAVVVAAALAAWRYIFPRDRDALLSEETVRRIRLDFERDERVRELDEARIVRRPSIPDDPAPATTALSRPWSERA